MKSGSLKKVPTQQPLKKHLTTSMVKYYQEFYACIQDTSTSYYHDCRMLCYLLGSVPPDIRLLLFRLSVSTRGWEKESKNKTKQKRK